MEYGGGAQIKDQVENCEVCNNFLGRQQKEPRVGTKRRVGHGLLVINFPKIKKIN